MNMVLLDIGMLVDVIAEGDKDQWLTYCTNKLQEDGFAPGIEWSTQITQQLTLEELIGALVYATQKINSLENDLDLAEKRAIYFKSMWNNLKTQHPSE